MKRVADMKKFKCPICSKIYVNKQALYTHLEDNHVDQMGELSPANYYFNMKYNKDSGKCIVCGRPTEFNEVTEKYDRIDRPVCKERYRKLFLERMRKTHGVDTLLTQPEHQKKMQQNRKIAGKYKWSDGKMFDYLGSYEKDALEFLDTVLNLRSEDVIAPAPIVVKYSYDGKNHFYMPDLYIIPFNLLIEIKGTNNHYQKRDILKEKTKDKAALASKYNYIKVLDKKYDGLVSIIESIKSNNDDTIR